MYSFNVWGGWEPLLFQENSDDYFMIPLPFFLGGFLVFQIFLIELLI